MAVLVAAAAAGQVPAQSASLGGVILADSSERPLANVEVLITDLKRSTRSDDRGAFLITGIDPGKHHISIRLPGWESYNADLVFAEGQKVEADFLLSPSLTKLEPVNVKAAPTKGPWAIKLQDFDERRLANAGGRFFTGDLFEKNQGSRITDILLGRIPGLRRVNLKNTPIAPLAGRTDGLRYNCYISILLNGLVVYNKSYGDNFYDIDRINAADVIGAEYYTLSNVPLRYGGADNPCGLLILWTK